MGPSPSYALASTWRTTIVRCENGLRILPERPRPRAWKRFITSPLPTWAWATTRSSTSSWWLFSALAIADSRHLRTSLATRLRENSRSASAVAIFLPRMSWASRLSFCGLTRSILATALASFSARARGWLFLLMTFPRSRRARRALGLAVSRVAVERAGRRELAELVADHLLGHQHRNVLVPVVDAEGEPDELRQDGRAAAPGLDHVVPAGRARGLRLLEQIAVDERAFPDRTRHEDVLALLSLLPRVAAGDDELGGLLVLAGLLALGREAPRRGRMAAALGAAAVRMIDRIHGDAAVVRHAAHPALAAGLADRDVHMVGVRHRADGRHAAAVHQALLGGVQPQDHVFLVAADDLRIGAGRARELAALADLHLDIVHDRADRNVADRHGVARLHVDMVAGDDRVADRETLRREDVGELAVLVLDQRNEAGAIRIVFDALDRRRDVVLGAPEVDRAQRLLVAAAAEARRDAAEIVAPAGRRLADGERLERLALVEAGAVDQDQLALARGRRLVVFECHRRSLPQSPVVTSMR